MPKCPNCGQPTARTKDWACQWCGYPLISKFYKEIPKSYRELKEERRHKWEQVVREETETSFLSPTHAPEPEAEVTLEAEPKPMLEPEDEVAPESEPKPMLEPEAEVAPESEPKPMPKPEAEVTPEAEAKPMLEPEAEVGMTAEELYSAYKANAVEADTKYKGTILKVTGTVHKIVTKDTFDIYYIMLTSAEKHEEWNVRCTFDKKHGPELKRLTAGQTVTVQGKYDGYRTNILMRDCALVG